MNRADSKLNFVLRLFYGGWDTDASLDATIRFLRRAHFAGVMFWDGYGHWEANHQSESEIASRAARLALVAPRVKSLGISAGLNVHTVGFTYSPPDLEPFGFDYQMNEAGEYDPKIACPLSPAFRAYVGRIMNTLAVPGIDYVMLDDDLNYMTGPACYCPLHMQAFSREIGRAIEREEWVAATHSGRLLPTDDKIAAWSRVQNDALLGLLKSAERGMRSRRPDLRLGMMGINTWMCDYGPDAARQMLGICRGPDKLAPLVRPSVVSYWDWTRFPAHGACSHFSQIFVSNSLPRDVTQLIEMDSAAPWTVFEHGAEHLRYIVERTIATGSRGIAFLLFPDGPSDAIPEEHPFTTMLERGHPRFEAIAELVGDEPIFEGVDCRPAAGLSTVNPRNDRFYGVPAFSLSRIGLPMAPTGEWTTILYGKQPWTVGAQKLPHYFGRGGIVDAGAIESLHAIDSASLIADVRLESLDEPPCGLMVTNHPLNGDAAGRFVTNLGSYRADCRHRLAGNFAEADVISWWVDSRFKRVGPAEVALERGDRRLALLAHRIDQQTPERQLLIANPVRMPIVQRICEWLARRPLPAVLRDGPDVFLFCMRSPDSRRRILTLVNNGFNRFDKLTIDLASLPGERCQIRTASFNGSIQRAENVELQQMPQHWRLTLPASLAPGPMEVAVIAIEAQE